MILNQKARRLKEYFCGGQLFLKAHLRFFKDRNLLESQIIPIIIIYLSIDK